jgi:hypothetical protein
VILAFKYLDFLGHIACPIGNGGGGRRSTTMCIGTTGKITSHLLKIFLWTGHGTFCTSLVTRNKNGHPYGLK